jgi:hypothetical protein
VREQLTALITTGLVAGVVAYFVAPCSDVPGELKAAGTLETP